MEPTTTPPAELLDRAGRALYGDLYVAPLAHVLRVDKNTLAKWRDGKSRIPTNVWHELATFLHNRSLMDLKAIEAQVLALAVPPRVVLGRNVNDSLIRLTRPLREEEHLTLQRNLDAFTSLHGLPKSVVASRDMLVVINIRANLVGDLSRIFREWFNAECDRIEREG